MRKREKDSMRQRVGERKTERGRRERQTDKYGKERETKREEGNRVRGPTLYYDFFKASSAIF